jgi:hypothetical protein
LNPGKQHAYILAPPMRHHHSQVILPSSPSVHEPVLLLLLKKASDMVFGTGTRLSGEESTRSNLASPTYSPQSDRGFDDRQELIFRPVMKWESKHCRMEHTMESEKDVKILSQSRSHVDWFFTG